MKVNSGSPGNIFEDNCAIRGRRHLLRFGLCVQREWHQQAGGDYGESGEFSDHWLRPVAMPPVTA